MGPAPTQMQNFPVPARSSLQWTEWFKGFQGDEAVLRGDNYDRALAQVDDWIRSDRGMNKETVGELDTFFERIADQQPSEILVEGQPWGALQQLLLGGVKLSEGLPFRLPTEESNPSAYAEAQPWVDLLRDGTFSEKSLAVLPVSYQTTDLWLAKLEESAEKHGMTWLHALHLGICYTERGDIDKPKQLFAQSLELKPNPIAARNLAVLSATAEEAYPYYEAAWATTHADFTEDPAYQRITMKPHHRDVLLPAAGVVVRAHAGLRGPGQRRRISGGHQRYRRLHYHVHQGATAQGAVRWRAAGAGQRVLPNVRQGTWTT